jgi:hypothetical protein
MFLGSGATLARDGQLGHDPRMPTNWASRYGRDGGVPRLDSNEAL